MITSLLSPNDIRTSTTTKELNLGAEGKTIDGRCFRYAQAGAAVLAPGKLAVVATIVANHENIAVAAAVAVEALKVTVTLGATAATENQYAGGTLTINDAAGEGISYLVSGHPAADASAALVVTLVEPVKVALTTSSEATLQANVWGGVVISAVDQADMPAGVATVSVPALSYFWAQTRGVVALLADETLPVGKDVTTGSSVAGAVEAVDLAAEFIVGTAIQAGVDTEYRNVYLKID